jgi:hypothetical protein
MVKMLFFEFSRNEQFVFTNIAPTNKLRLQSHLTNTEPRSYVHFNNVFYEKKSTSENIQITNRFQRTRIRKFGK